jgi:hypothetical protein
MEKDNKYISLLKKRGKVKKITKSYQMTGLKIAELLEDPEHKGLYMKLAKKYNENFLLGLAKDVSERKNIENKGGYFMIVFKQQKDKIKNKDR